MHIAGIRTYPVFSGSGIALSETTLGENGMVYDRRWLIVDPWTNEPVTRRQHPKIAEISVLIDASLLRLVVGGHDLVLPLCGEGGHVRKRRVRVAAGDYRFATDLGSRVAGLLSHYLGVDCTMVRLEDSVPSSMNRRPLPLIGVSTESLRERSEEELGLSPHFIIEGCEPDAERNLREVCIGAVRAQVVDNMNNTVGVYLLPLNSGIIRLGDEVCIVR